MVCVQRKERLTNEPRMRTHGDCESSGTGLLCTVGGMRVHSRIARVNPSRRDSGSSVVIVGIGMAEVGRASTSA